jgi:hypothetical protein
MDDIYNTLDVYNAIAFVDDEIRVYTTELIDNQDDKAKVHFIGAKLDNFRNIRELLNELYERRKSSEKMK